MISDIYFLKKSLCSLCVPSAQADVVCLCSARRALLAVRTAPSY